MLNDLPGSFVSSGTLSPTASCDHCIIYGNLYCHEQKPKSFERDLEIVYIALTPNADWNDLFDAALHCHKQRVIIEGVHFD